MQLTDELASLHPLSSRNYTSARIVDSEAVFRVVHLFRSLVHGIFL